MMFCRLVLEYANVLPTYRCLDLFASQISASQACLKRSRIRSAEDY